MPISAPEKVATSPNATRSDSCICPCGSIKTPQKRSISPPKLKIAAVINWIFGFMILKILCKDTHKNGTFANKMGLECYVPPLLVLHSPDTPTYRQKKAQPQSRLMKTLLKRKYL